MKLSVIVPVYNEDACILDFYEEITKVLNGFDFNIIFVDDGSSDKSLKILKELYSKDKDKVKIINFSRNFGKDAAIYAGLKNSDSEYTAIIDADLQQNPKYLLKMIEELENEVSLDEVCMVQQNKKERFFQKIFYKIINKISKINFVVGASDFRMFKKQVVDKIISLGESNRFSKGIFSWVGFNVKYINYTVEERKKGTSKWNFFKLFSYAIDGFINFSIAPLKIAIYTGTLSSVVAFIYFIAVIIKTLFLGENIQGYPTIVSLILLIGGIQLLCIGILGEYLGKTYLETKQRPIYIEKERIGFNESLL